MKHILPSLSALGAVAFTGAANAASATAPTGVNAGFFDLQTDLSSILNGDGGAAIIIGGVLIGAGVLAFTGRWTASSTCGAHTEFV